MPGGRARVGVVFYGRNPPQGADSLPAGLFLMEGDVQPVFAEKAIAVVSLRLLASQAPGGQEQEEEAVVEQVTEHGARVRVTSLYLMKGVILEVQEVGESFFRTGAEVENIRIGADGHPRVDLLFLDAPAPESWGATRK